MPQSTEDFARAIVETISDAIVTIDVAGIIQTVNPGCLRMFGYSEEELVGHKVNILMPEPYAREHDEYLARYFSTGEKRLIGTSREVVGRRKCGETFPLYLSVGEGRFVDGTRWFVGVLQDLSSLRRAETAITTRQKKLEAALAELDSFTYSVSHDLRSPVRAVFGFVRILLRDHGSQLDEEGRRLLQIVKTNAELMGELIDSLLTLSRLGRRTPQMTDVCMSDLAREVLAQLLSLESGRSIDVTVGDLPDSYGDPALMRLVWTNLLENAFKYTKQETAARIRVEGQEVAESIQYSVEDNGAGFNMKYVHKLFGAFQRLHNVEEFPGTGVGLASVRKIVQLHAGTVWAEGKVGSGAKFFFSLPKRKVAT